MDEALQAIAAAADAGSRHGAAPLVAGAMNDGAATLSEWDGKQCLAAYNVPVPAGAQAEDVAQAESAAEEIGFPVVVKAVGAALAHKTELGAVRLNLRHAAAVRNAAEALLPLTGRVLVERMVEDVAAELIVGIARDAVLGPYLVIGSGGVLAELVGDTAMLLLPAGRDEIERALLGLRVAKLLGGFRGAPPGDLPAAISAILAIQDFAVAHAQRLHELDVNPLMVRHAGLGAVAADVLMRLAPEHGNG